MKVPSNEPSTFMMWIVDGRFACHIMNTHSRPFRHLHDMDSNDDVFTAIHICDEKCKCRPKGKKESKNQLIEDKDKKLFRM
jgi:hypothetical protein